MRKKKAKRAKYKKQKPSTPFLRLSFKIIIFNLK